MPRGSRSDFDRYLDYKARHSGWIAFRSVFWAIYLLVIGVLLIVNGRLSFPISWATFFGVALVLLAVMIVIYGVAELLHHKLMRKHG